MGLDLGGSTSAEDRFVVDMDFPLPPCTTVTFHTWIFNLVGRLVVGSTSGNSAEACCTGCS